VLGEQAFASEGTRRRIRERFPSGWVVAEVLIQGVCWTVARPFAVGAHPFAVRETTLEALHDSTSARTDFQAFLSELQSAAVDAIPSRRFPASDEPIRWDHLLPWLARDQECRFSDLLEWRHNSTGSGAPALSVEERQFLVRSILGLVSDEERAEQRRNAQLVAQKREAERTAPRLEHQANVDHWRLRDFSGVDLPPLGDDLFGTQVRDEIERRRNDLERRMDALEKSDNRRELQSALESAVAAEATARRDLEDAELRLKLERRGLAELRGDAQVEVFAALSPGRGFCNVPMELARRRGCPLASSRPLDLAEKRSQRTAAEEIAEMEAVVRELERVVEEKRSAFAAAQARLAEARQAFLKATTRYDAERGRLLEERAQLEHAERLAKQAADAWTRVHDARQVVAELEKEIGESYKRQEVLRQERDEALGRFSAAFDYIVRALLGDEVTGKVETSGRALNLRVDHHGERESAALATIKLLAFDLAALTESIEGRGFFPRFLIHDGPHEADMDPSIYERLFLLVRQLEACFDTEPNFQYIVTTTAPPPEVLRKAPWLLQPVLDASRPEGRLLGVDL
jgi:hypothetical protein